MNTPQMSSPRPEFLRRAARTLVPAALLALAPKCLVCVIAYAGLGAALGLGGPELCGAPAGSPGWSAASFAQVGLAVILGAVGVWLCHRRSCARPHPICTAG